MELVTIKNKENFLDYIKGKLIVSCQALPDEPLHSSFIMGRMAYAAYLAGASAIRANSVEDIKEIKKRVDLPIIGIIKEVYDNSDVFITPTMEEVTALCEEGVTMIALDATDRLRPDGRKIEELFPLIKEKYPNQLFMADCSTYEEAIAAGKMGFDVVSTTLHGHTSYTEESMAPNLNLIKKIMENSTTLLIAEGGIWSPEQLKSIMQLGVHAAVVGSAITRPKEITEYFLKAMQD